MEPPTVLVRNKSTTSTALPAVLLCYFCTQSIKFIFAVTTENSKYMQDVSCERKIIKEQKKAKRVKIHSAGNKFKKWRAITSKINWYKFYFLLTKAFALCERACACAIMLGTWTEYLQSEGITIVYKLFLNLVICSLWFS